MSKNTTNGGDANSRRQFLQQTAAVTGAVLLGGALTNTLAAAPANTPQAPELAVAIELMTQGNLNKECDLLLFILDAATGSARGAESVTDEIDRLASFSRKSSDRAARLEAMRRDAHERVRDAVAALGSYD